MNWLRACPLLIIVAAIYFLLTAVRDDKLRIAVEGGRIQWEPATVRLRIRVEPDKANRALAVGIDSGEFGRSSAFTLEGERAQRTVWIEYRDVPAGEYVVRAEVYRPSAEPWYASETLTIRGY